MAKKLYVGNLSYQATQEEIRELFSQAGEVQEVTIITDRETGRSKGFGFVEMATEEAAQEAIKRFNGHNLGSRALTVNEARPREERPRNNFSSPRREFSDFGGGGSNFGGGGGNYGGGGGGKGKNDNRRGSGSGNKSRDNKGSGGRRNSDWDDNY